MKINKIYLVYGFNSDYSNCGDGDGKVHFIKSFLDKEEADELRDSLSEKITRINKETQTWNKGERARIMLTEDVPGWDDKGYDKFWSELQAKSPSNKWQEKDVDGEIMALSFTSFHVQELVVE